MTQANLKKIKVRIIETNDDTPTKVRGLVNVWPGEYVNTNTVHKHSATLLAKFSNYAELCTFEYAWSTAEEGTSTSCVSRLFVASAIWASSTAEEDTSAFAISTDLCT